MRIRRLKTNLSWDKSFLQIAEVLGNKSHCVSQQVGAIAVLDGRILSSGINGTPSGECNCDEIFSDDFDPVAHREWSDIHEVHAEMNMISFAAKYGVSLDGSTMYSTLQPCNQCVKNIIQAGVKRIVYAKKYRRVTEKDNQIVVNRLRKLNISYEHISED